MLRRKRYDKPSLFTPQNLLREARRQKSIRKGRVPPVCVLDPDGDIVRFLAGSRRASLDAQWACYHTQLFDFSLGGQSAGIVGCAVGAPFAVLVAEEMFASGCRFLLSITSAGRVRLSRDRPRFLVLGRALRDEGTSSHYIRPGAESRLDPVLAGRLAARLDASPVPLAMGTSWTTDAPFRETTEAIAEAARKGAHCVEMEAAALYALAAARSFPIVCLAHVTNSMAQSAGDFEKGPESGSLESLKLLEFIAKTLRGAW